VGGGQSNKQQASQAFGGAAGQVGTANRLSATGADTSGKYNAQQQQLYNTLWGSPSGGGGGGAVSPFLNPAALNVTSPTGPYNLMYKNAAGQIDTGAANAVGAAAQRGANAGFGTGSPSGFYQNQQLQAQLGAAGQKAGAYQAATTQSYQDALNNFWNAVKSAQTQTGQATTGGSEALNSAIGANQGGAQTYSQLYGTAGQYHQNPAADIAGKAIGAAGTVGGAAMCVCEGTPIWMADGSYEMVEKLRAGDRVMSADDHEDIVESVETTDEAQCWMISTDTGEFLRASGSHTIARSSPGYVTVKESTGVSVLCKDKAGTVIEVASLGKRKVYKLKLRYAHIYLSGGIYSLE
jgi:hypothetical protein